MRTPKEIIRDLHARLRSAHEAIGAYITQVREWREKHDAIAVACARKDEALSRCEGLYCDSAAAKSGLNREQHDADCFIREARRWGPTPDWAADYLAVVRIVEGVADPEGVVHSNSREYEKAKAVWDFAKSLEAVIKGQSKGVTHVQELLSGEVIVARSWDVPSIPMMPVERDEDFVRAYARRPWWRKLLGMRPERSES